MGKGEGEGEGEGSRRERRWRAMEGVEVVGERERRGKVEGVRRD